MTEDPVAYRQRAREGWEAAAEGWDRHHRWWDAQTRAVSTWLVDAISPQPGQTVLELAAGPGDVGLLVAELVRPGGKVVLTDGAEKMVEAARRRAGERGLEDVVEARPMEAEWIDLPAAAVDAVVCRWGYMLLADPDAALRETRRVLRPGGVVALAAWADAEANPWMTAAAQELDARGLAPPRDPDAPGPFAWADPDAIAERLADAGFLDVAVDTVAFTIAYPDLDAWWDTQVDMSPTLRAVLAAADPAVRDELMEGAQARVAGYVAEGGAVELPALTRVARAEA
ncbi:MAG: methyltransferase domain-containing protein [Solirubrobacteraceae bacterium]|nr:methyltransferase domain-containing protein [Solirubrobacteraceae bacterium]